MWNLFVIAQRYRICFSGTGLISLGLLLILVITESRLRESSIPEFVWLAITIGTLLGHTTVAAVWMAAGPFPAIWRLPLSLAWLTLLVLATLIQVHRDASGVLQFGGCMLIEWLAVQFLYRVLARVFHWRLHFVADTPGDALATARQYSIGQLLGVTTIAAVVMGIARAVLTMFPPVVRGSVDSILAFVVLIACSAAICLPPILLLIMPALRWGRFAVILGIYCIVTLIEVGVLGSTAPRLPPNPLRDIGSFNVVAMAWALAFGIMTRACGYRLTSIREQLKQDTTAFPNSTE